jgi:hypothetical protein
MSPAELLLRSVVGENPQSEGLHMAHTSCALHRTSRHYKTLYHPLLSILEFTGLNSNTPSLCLLSAVAYMSRTPALVAAFQGCQHHRRQLLPRNLPAVCWTLWRDCGPFTALVGPAQSSFIHRPWLRCLKRASAAQTCGCQNFSHILNAFDDAPFSPTLHNQLHPQLSQPPVPSGPFITKKSNKKIRKLQKSPATTADNRLSSPPTVACSPTVVLRRNLTLRKCQLAARSPVRTRGNSGRLYYPAHRPQLVQSAR